MSQDAGRWEKIATLGVILVAAGIAMASALTYAGSWNDGSRLATVEALVDHRTWAIDQSIFVKTPASDSEARNPYRFGDKLKKNGTFDKLYINGHYYSDKSPVPALLLAIFYACCQVLFGLKASTQPEIFCYWMTVASCGVPYVIAVLATFKMGRLVGLTPFSRWLLTGSFALATIALVYARQVNSHLPLLSVTAVLMLALAALAKQVEDGPWSRRLVVGIGCLAGLGYSIDLGTGPLLLAFTGLLIAWRCRRAGALALFALGALPWLACHHAINYSIGGTWGPANAVPEYFDWPDVQFPDKLKLTGTWHHANVLDFLEYAAGLLFGKRGFVGHNLPLFLLVPAGAFLLCLRPREWPELLLAWGYCGATWLVYAALSNNYAGGCCSVRWFVPLLAPAYYVLAVLLKFAPRFRIDLLLLTVWGIFLVSLAWYDGPWYDRLPGYWYIQGAALASWAALLGWKEFNHGSHG